ncbi:16S rRNA (guanine(966)-N(2))-methyltransferase RsmD [candidate division WOR-3 bacterium]|nr:16S rRNA (guanine(966)-N(2))-methyltransferase RsmD [candidate division WOR-3 bacterium]
MCKRRSLKVPAKGVRPTRGMIREAVFNILGDRIVDAEVLDIFAGSGALGIEALSRGAKHCTFIEKSARVLRANIASLSLKEQTTVLAGDFRPALRRLKGRNFDVVFADPPYKMDYVQPTIELIVRHTLLARDGMIVVEHSSIEDLSLPDELTAIKKKQYGTTSISYIVHRIQ